MPRVSVIMPCYNHARFVAESVRGVLGQSHADLELIVVDDCSRDDSWEVISGLARSDSRIKAIRHETNGGASRSRNDGMRAASGAFIGFCDADDVWKPGKLASQLRLLQGDRPGDVAYCDALIMDGEGRVGSQRFSDLFALPGDGSGELFPELIRRNFINMQSVLMRRECIGDAGYFDEGIKWVEDWWYWIRISRRHRFLYDPEPLALYRVHGNSTNLVQKRGYRANRYKVFRRILREYPDLPKHSRAEILYQMGVELCGLGKSRVAGGLFRNSARLAFADVRALSSFWRALGRLAIVAGTPKTRACSSK